MTHQQTQTQTETQTETDTETNDESDPNTETDDESNLHTCPICGGMYRHSLSHHVRFSCDGKREFADQLDADYRRRHASDGA